MPDIAFVIKADNQSSPAFKAAATDLGNLNNAAKGYGSATTQAKAAAASFYDRLRAGKADADAAAGGFAGLGHAAKSAAEGGIRSMASEIPVVGGALSKLASGFSGVELAQAGLVGAGIAVIQYLRQLDAEASKTLTEIEKLSEGIGTHFQQTLLDVQKITAQANQDRIGVITASYKQELALAETTKKEKIAAAKAEYEENDTLWRQFTGQRAMDEAKFRTAQAQADEEAASRAILAEKQKQAALVELARNRLEIVKELYASVGAAEAAADAAVLSAQGNKLAALNRTLGQEEAAIEQSYAKRLETIEREFSDAAEKDTLRVAAYREMQANLTKSATEGAEQRRVIVEQEVAAAINVYQKLGAGFEDITRKLSAVQFVQSARRDIEALKALGEAIASGDKDLAALGVTSKDVADGIAKLKEQIQQTIATGTVPLADSAKAAAAAATEMGQAGVDAGEAWLKSMEGLSPEMDAIIAKTREMKAAIAGATGGGPGAGAPGAAPKALGGGGTYYSGGGGYGPDYDAASRTIASMAMDMSNRWGPLPPLTSGASTQGYGLSTMSLAEYAKSLNPNPSPAGVFSKGGPTPYSEPYANAQMVPGTVNNNTTVNLNVNQSGTIVSNDRDWNTIGANLAAQVAGE